MIAAADVAQAPQSPGVYYLLDEGHRLLYVGKAVSLRRRLRDHSRTARWGAVARIAFEETGSEANALEREATILGAIQPPWNKSHIDAFFAFVTPTRNGLRLGRDGEYGCLPHLGRGAMSNVGRACIDGFDALNRIVKVTRPEPRLLHRFLTGQSDALLRVDLDVDQPHIRHGIERDRLPARGFYDAGPKAMRRLRLRYGTSGVVSREQYIDWIRGEVRALLGNFD